MGATGSKKVGAELHDTKAKVNIVKKLTVQKSDQSSKMPSIDQCEVASGVTALPSTLEIFDTFKPVTDNGKDSDSEESFHLPLDDDDMESHSVASNGRDKEIHNEETEDDILNKFETVPSGTPDNIDPHIEDSILDDVDNISDKDVDALAAKVILKQTDSSSASHTDLSENNKESIESKPQPDNSLSKDKNKSNSENKNKTKVEVKITYDFGDYEDSGDGEFKSIYETDDVAAVLENEHAEVKSEKAAESIEPMEISEESEPASVTCDLEKEKSEPSQESQKIEEPLDNFQDSMEVEQEDANQDIANIIEKLEGQDAPMADVEALSGESDVNMTESCEETTLPNEKIETDKSTGDNNENILEKGAALAGGSTEDVEMGDEQQHENSKENADQPEVVSTFREPLEESKDTTEACAEEAQPEISVNKKEQPSENEKEIEDQIVSKECTSNSNKTDDQKTESLEKNESPKQEEEKQQEPSKNIAELDSSKEDMETLELSPEKSLESIEAENVDSLKPENNDGTSCDKEQNVGEATASPKDNAQVDDLLNELDKTINESDKKTSTTESSENKTSDASAEVSEKEQENVVSKDEEVFKVPEEVSKVSDELPAQKEGKESPDENEKSDDKTDDESDLLDISMVRETDEDDACAIADALDDKEAQISERSDEEQSEKVETEQESSDVDKDNDDNDNEPIDFDDSDDSRMDGVENEDSSNAGSSKGNKIINISESSKDSMSDCEPRKRRRTIDSSTDVSNDVTPVGAVDETEKNDVSNSVLTDKSLNLDSTLVQDEAVSPTAEKDSSFSPIANKADSENKVGAKEDKNDASDISKTEKDRTVAKESSESPMDVGNQTNVELLPEVSKSTEDSSAKRKTSLNKRTLSTSDVEETEISAKKPKLTSKTADSAQSEKEAVENSTKKTPEAALIQDTAVANEKVKTLTGFSKFMQCRKFTAKLTRSDLEQFCIQKICESLMLKSSEGELHQTIKKHEKTIDILRKDLQQLSKQCKDLEIVNKKLMNELRSQNNLKKPLVPLKITRSVGLQVRLNPGNETVNQNRRRQPISGSTTPQKPIVNSTTNAVVNRAKVTPGNTQQPPVVRQVLQNSPQKSPLTTGQTTTNNATPTNPLLSQALQQQKPRQQAVAAKRTATPVRKPPEAPKPANPGVIDLTDEDDRLAANKTVPGNTIKIMNKAVSPANAANKTLTLGKMVPGKAVANQGKQGVQKTVTVGANKGGALSQGIRLTPASVITSSANGSPQMVYVVPTITSNAGGTQKVAFVNFQPTNGVLSGTLNGSTVSVMSNKGQTLKIVSSPMRHKHPAPLPAPPRINPDPKLKPLLPKPQLTIKKIDTGIILQWKMPYNLDLYENIASYQLYAYQETSAPPSTDMWRKVGDVKALALPMACTLTQFADKNKYYFAVRSVDVHKRIGAFSDPEEISL